MLIVVIVYVLVIFGIAIWLKREFKNCKSDVELIVFVLYFLITLTPMIIYLCDVFNIPSNFNMTKNINTQSWLGGLISYTSSVISAIISAIVSIKLVFVQIRKNSEDTEKRDKKNWRLQNMPVMSYEFFVDSADERPFSLETGIKDGTLGDIDLLIKNVGLNNARDLKIIIEGDVVRKDKFIDIRILEKNQAKTILLTGYFKINEKYNFKIKVIYKDLLFNEYEQEIKFVYILSNRSNGTKRYYIIDDLNVNEEVFLENQK